MYYMRICLEKLKKKYVPVLGQKLPPFLGEQAQRVQDEIHLCVGGVPREVEPRETYKRVLLYKVAKKLFFPIPGRSISYEEYSACPLLR